MTRHELREAVFRNVFQIPFYEDDIPELEELGDDEEDIPESQPY